MKDLFEVSNTTRQAFHAWTRPSPRELARTPKQEVVRMASDIRKNHLPGSSARELYFFIRNKHPKYSEQLIGWGKHSFEKICLDSGFRVTSRRFVPKTTQRGDYVFDNKIKGQTIDNVNRVWVSDISYIYGDNNQLLGYSTSVIDLYSRRLLGLSFSRTMHAIVTIMPAIGQALKTRKACDLSWNFFHSDGGKQFIFKEFIKLLRSEKITSSMASNCFENAHAEAFNDTLKNHLLCSTSLHSFSQLKKLEQHFRYCYNHNKPHTSLNGLTPVEFEEHLLTLQPFQRTKMLIKSE